MSWKVNFFQTARGEYPVKQFIEDLDIPTQAKVLHSIELLVDFGPFLKPPIIKKMQKGLYELRIIGKLAVRIFYSPSNNEYYLLHAFKKKSQKTPTKEINIAIDRMKELI